MPSEEYTLAERPGTDPVLHYSNEEVRAMCITYENGGFIHEHLAN